MTYLCTICSTNCKKVDAITCAFCNSYQHISCVSKLPNLSQSALESISKVKPGYMFGCKKCVISSAANSSNSKIDAIEKQLSDLTNIIKENITSQLTDIKSDISKSISRNEKFETETNKKIENLQSENDFLHRQLNRADIVVSGIPSHLSNTDLYSTAIKIGKACDVNVIESDINFCTWIRRKSAVLIKFNSVLKRDSIMQQNII